MASFRIREAAQDDLLEIGVQGREEWGNEQMRGYLAALVKAFDALADMPELGRAFEEIFAGGRRYLCGAHVVFYEIGADGIVEIVRVLHGRMQHDLHFPDE